MSRGSGKKRRDEERKRTSTNIWGMAICVFLIAFLTWTMINSQDDGGESGEVEWHVFLAGTNGYSESENVPSLNFAERDVDDLRALFKEWGVKDENIIVLKTENSDVYKTTTRKSILKNYEKFVTGLKKNSIAFVFLSGHGFSEGKKSYYAPRDYIPNDEDSEKISIDEMLKRLAKSNASFKWMCVDACRDRMPTRSLTSSALMVTGVPRGVVLTQSCKEGQLSYEARNVRGIGDSEEDAHDGEPNGNGLFTRALLEAIDVRSSKADVDMDGNITLGEIRSYLYERVSEDAKKIYKSEQEPDFTVGKGESIDEIDNRILFKDPKVPGLKLYSRAKELKSQGEYDKALFALDEAEKILHDAPEIAALRKEIEREMNSGSDEHVVTPPPLPPTPHNVIRKTVDIAGCRVAFIWIAPGKFTMGSPEDEENRSGNENQREVEIATGFWFAEVETTQMLWQAVMGNNPSANQGDDLPVENVSWEACLTFIDRINELAPANVKFSIPTEEHWEYACRAGSSATYWWGSDPTLGRGKLNGYDQSGKAKLKKGWTSFDFDDEFATTAPVGTFAPNAWGVRDMLGNVGEWCDSAFEGDASKRTIRGGGWRYDIRTCRSAYRDGRSTSYQSDDLGFRLEMTETANLRHTVTIAGIPVTFRWIAPGKFVMGSSEDDEERDGTETLREVEIPKGFWLAELETTQALWRAVMGDNPSQYQGDNLPVENVSWNDCQLFLDKINAQAPTGMKFCLPPEEHWEYACRAGNGDKFWWGANASGGAGKANVYDEACHEAYQKGWLVFPFNDGYVETAPVGSFAANAWGLKDMVGNVWEWCASACGEELLPGNIEFDTSGASSHAIRGGCWQAQPRLCRSAYRAGLPDNFKADFLGFRLAMTENSN